MSSAAIININLASCPTIAEVSVLPLSNGMQDLQVHGRRYGSLSYEVVDLGALPDIATLELHSLDPYPELLRHRHNKTLHPILSLLALLASRLRWRGGSV